MKRLTKSIVKHLLWKLHKIPSEMLCVWCNQNDKKCKCYERI